MSEQIGWQGFLKLLRKEAPNYFTLLPQLPRLLHQYLNNNPTARIEAMLEKLVSQEKRRNQLLGLAVILLLGILISGLFQAFP